MYMYNVLVFVCVLVELFCILPLKVFVDLQLLALMLLSIHSHSFVLCFIIRSGLNLEEVLAAAELILGSNEEVMEMQKENGGGRGGSVGGRRGGKRKRKQNKKKVKRRKINGRSKAEG